MNIQPGEYCFRISFTDKEGAVHVDYLERYIADMSEFSDVRNHIRETLGKEAVGEITITHKPITRSIYSYELFE